MSPNEAWKSALLSLRPDFDAGALRFPDLRVYMFQGDVYQEGEVRLKLYRMAEGVNFPGLRPTLTTMWPIDEKRPAPTNRYFTFCGERDGANRFQEIAHSAGCCAVEHFPWAADYDAPLVHFSPQDLWTDSIFRVAWEFRASSPLRASKGRSAELPRGCFHSFLTINPFRASVVLIDMLSGDEPEVTPTDASVESGEAAGATERRKQANTKRRDGGPENLGTKLTGTSYRLICYLWSRESASYEDLLDGVWKKHVEDDAVTRAVKRTNKALEELDEPFTLVCKNGHVTIDFLDEPSGQNPDK